MALNKKTLGKVLDTFTAPNNIKNGGGLSSYLVPRKINAVGGLTIAGAIGAASIVKEGIQGHNRAKLGKVRYGDGPARMTNSFTSGVVPAMMKASRGNYDTFSDMAEEVITNDSIGGKIENYGATPALISALYNMGGR